MPPTLIFAPNKQLIWPELSVRASCPVKGIKRHRLLGTCPRWAEGVNSLGAKWWWTNFTALARWEMDSFFDRVYRHTLDLFPKERKLSNAYQPYLTIVWNKSGMQQKPPRTQWTMGTSAKKNKNCIWSWQELQDRQAPCLPIYLIFFIGDRRISW